MQTPLETKAETLCAKRWLQNVGSEEMLLLKVVCPLLEWTLESEKNMLETIAELKQNIVDHHDTAKPCPPSTITPIRLRALIFYFLFYLGGQIAQKKSGKVHLFINLLFNHDKKFYVQHYLPLFKEFSSFGSLGQHGKDYAAYAITVTEPTRLKPSEKERKDINSTGVIKKMCQETGKSARLWLQNVGSYVGSCKQDFEETLFYNNVVYPLLEWTLESEKNMLETIAELKKHIVDHHDTAKPCPPSTITPIRLRVLIFDFLFYLGGQIAQKKSGKVHLFINLLFNHDKGFYRQHYFPLFEEFRHCDRLLPHAKDCATYATEVTGRTAPRPSASPPQQSRGITSTSSYKPKPPPMSTSWLMRVKTFHDFNNLYIRVISPLFKWMFQDPKSRIPETTEHLCALKDITSEKYDLLANCFFRYFSGQYKDTITSDYSKFSQNVKVFLTSLHQTNPDQYKEIWVPSFKHAASATSDITPLCKKWATFAVSLCPACLSDENPQEEKSPESKFEGKEKETKEADKELSDDVTPLFDPLTQVKLFKGEEDKGGKLEWHEVNFGEFIGNMDETLFNQYIQLKSSEEIYTFFKKHFPTYSPFLQHMSPSVDDGPAPSAPRLPEQEMKGPPEVDLLVDPQTQPPPPPYSYGSKNGIPINIKQLYEILLCPVSMEIFSDDPPITLFETGISYKKHIVDHLPEEDDFVIDPTTKQRCRKENLIENHLLQELIMKSPLHSYLLSYDKKESDPDEKPPSPTAFISFRELKQIFDIIEKTPKDPKEKECVAFKSLLEQLEFDICEYENWALLPLGFAQFLQDKYGWMQRPSLIIKNHEDIIHLISARFVSFLRKKAFQVKETFGGIAISKTSDYPFLTHHNIEKLFNGNPPVKLTNTASRILLILGDDRLPPYKKCDALKETLENAMKKKRPYFSSRMFGGCRAPGVTSIYEELLKIIHEGEKTLSHHQYAVRQQQFSSPLQFTGLRP